MTTELVQIKEQFEELHNKYRQYLPEVDPALIEDLLCTATEVSNSSKHILYVIDG